MKKVNLLGIIFSLMFLWIIGQPLEVQAKEYYWTTRSGVTGWYENQGNGIYNYMDSVPSNLSTDDDINIMAALDEENANWLANLNQSIYSLYIDVPEDTTVVVGKNGGDFQASIIDVEGGNVTYNGLAISLAVMCSDVHLSVNGDIVFLQLGTRSTSQLYSSAISPDIIVNGDVSEVAWYKSRTECNETYHSFIGNCIVSGVVSETVIYQKFYDDVLEKNVFAQSAEIGKCEAGTFRITNGTLSNAVSVTNKEVTFEYYNIYQCHLSYGWMKQYYNKASGMLATQKSCNKDEIKAGDKVIVFSTDEALTFDMDLSRLQVCSGDITFNGNIVEGEVKLPPDGLSISVPSNDEMLNFRFTGTASNASISYSYNPNCDVYIDGKIDGTYWQDNKLQGYFECENVQLIKDGIWNKNVLIKTSLDDDALSYGTVDKETVEDAVADETIGQEIVDGDYTIYKDVETTIKQTAQDIIDSIAKADDFKDVLESIIEKLEETVEEVLDAKPICAVDISIDSFYRDKSTGNVYTANPTYGKENISELPQGNTLEFSVKVPKVHYKEDAKYTIVRQHENADGSVAMEQLETTQNGDILTFESDKFSTFVIVEVTEKVDTTIEIKNADGTVVKTDGIFGDGTYSLENLTAGTYTVKVARENYVSRTYTIEIEDSEIVEIEVELHKLGDITGDGVINARDKKTLFNHIAGTSKLTDYAFTVADVNGDGVINARDKKMVFNHIAGTNSLWK